LTLLVCCGCARHEDKSDPNYEGKALSAWIADMKSEDAGVRSKAALALGEIGSGDNPGIDALRGALKDSDPPVRIHAAFALARISPQNAQEAVAVLIEVLQEEMPDQRRYAARVLSRLGPRATAAVPALINALKDQDAGVRSESAAALAQIGPDAKAAVDPLISVLKDEEARVRLNAARALYRISKERTKLAVGVFRDHLKDPEAKNRYITAKMLCDVGPDAKDAVDDLTKALDDESEIVRDAAQEALRIINPEGAKRRPSTP